MPKQMEADVAAWATSARDRGIWTPQPQLDPTQYAMTAAAGRAYGVFGYIPPPVAALEGGIVSGRHYKPLPSGLAKRQRYKAMEVPGQVSRNKALIMRKYAATFQNTTLGPKWPERKNVYTTQKIAGYPGVTFGITGHR